MKKVKEIYYIDNREERTSDFSTGFVYVLEDGSKVETMSSDTIAERYTKPQKSYCKLHSFTGSEADRETCPDCNSCEDCGTFLGDSTIAMCKCGKYKW